MSDPGTQHPPGHTGRVIIASPELLHTLLPAMEAAIAQGGSVIVEIVPKEAE